MYGTVSHYSWNDWNAVLWHKENNKGYGLILEIPESKLGVHCE